MEGEDGDEGEDGQSEGDEGEGNVCTGSGLDSKWKWGGGGESV